jgi:thiamine biosynthesis lipoprotein
MASISLVSGGLASSGDYERGIVVEGKRYSHLLNPQTGYPVSGLLSVSIQAEKCIMAGALATTAMIMGKAGFDWLDTMGLPYLVMDEDHRITGSLSE